jgi:transposase
MHGHDHKQDGVDQPDDRGLKQAETGMPVEEVIRRTGVSEQTFYRWKKVYGGVSSGPNSSMDLSSR